MPTPPPPAGWTAVILAGQRPGVDALAAAHGETYKALVRIGGRPMLTRVAETLRATPGIARRIVLAQRVDVLRDAVGADAADAWEEAGPSIAGSVLALIERGAAAYPILVTTADHPLLDPALVAAFLAGAGGHDLSIGVVERATIRAAYPDNRRTYLRFADGAYSGANLFALASPRAAAALAFWMRAERDRKRPVRLMLHAGPWLAIRAVTRTIGFAALLAKLGARLGFAAAPVILDRAEAAIDVDKPADHALASTILAVRESGADRAAR